ncbi:MAG: cell division protein FtsQ/DivIB [Candidatus Caldatribacteriaceae bacterium]
MTTLEVEGNRNFVGNRLARYLEGLKGRNIFGVRSWELQQVLKSVPGVKRVEVEKVLPHTLRIKIEERQPEVALERGAGLTCLDGDGVEVPCEGESRIQVVKVRGLEEYGYSPEYETLLKEVLALVATWRNFFDYPLEGIEVAGERLFILRLRNGIVIRCGGALNLKNKAVLLRPYLREVNIRSIKVFGFDLQAGEDIVIMTGGSQ